MTAVAREARAAESRLVAELFTVKTKVQALTEELKRTPAKRWQPLPFRLLFEGPRSGAGEVADWSQAAEVASRAELILGGGLTPENVGPAIAAVRPFGVDVSSGVESAPGRKDPALVWKFVTAARKAADGLSR